MSAEADGGRYFFALAPTASQADVLRAALPEEGPDSRRRTVRAGNLHMTLTFVGRADEQALRAAAGRVRAPAFDVLLERIEYVRRGGMLWATPVAIPDALQTLVNNLRDELNVAGVAFDAKPFKAHVTLARKASAVANTTLAAQRWRCTEFYLMASTSSAEGVVYRRRATWPLR